MEVLNLTTHPLLYMIAHSLSERYKNIQNACQTRKFNFLKKSSIWENLLIIIKPEELQINTLAKNQKNANCKTQY